MYTFDYYIYVCYTIESLLKLLIQFVYLYLGLQIEEVRGMSHLITKKRRLLRRTLIYSTLFAIQTNEMFQSPLDL